MSERVELTILRNLFFNEDFTRKVTPFIKPDYFTSRDERILFEEVEKFFEDHFDWFATAGSKTKVIGTTIYYWKKKDAPTMWVSDTVKGE